MAFYECTGGGKKTISLNIAASADIVANSGHYIWFTVSKDGKTIFSSPKTFGWSIGRTVNINCE